MRHITFFWVVCSLALSGCFDDAVTLGLDCENDLECGEGQACGPGVLEDNGSPTPALLCGIPADEGWEACQDTDPTICGEDFKTARVCRNGFRTETDCDVVCEAQPGNQRNDGLCGADVPETNADCACAYAINESPNAAKDCFQTEAGLDVVRSKAFVSDDVAVYLRTCDEWCKLQSEIPNYEGSVCAETFEDLAADAFGNAIAGVISSRLGDDAPCVCQLAEEPDCSGGQPQTRCLDSNAEVSAVVFCAGPTSALIQCPGACGPLPLPGMSEIDWCL